MSKFQFSIALSAAITCASAYALPSAQGVTYSASTSYCWQPPAYKEDLVWVVRSAVTATGVAADDARTALGLLADVADSVYVVTDDELCRRASRSREMLKASPDTTNLGPILVVKAGRFRYTIDDGRTTGGEWRVAFVTDTTFTVIGTFLR